MSVYTSDTPAPLSLEQSGWLFFNGTLFQVSTFDLEVELIWKKKLSLAQILYFVNRYVGDALFLYGTAVLLWVPDGAYFQRLCVSYLSSPFPSLSDPWTWLKFQMSVLLLKSLYPVQTFLTLLSSTGQSFGTVQTFLSVTTLGAMQGIMVHRIVSMYRHERKILIGLAGTFIVEMSAACILAGLSVRLAGAPVELSETLRSCIPVDMVAWSSALWFLMMIFDFLIFLLAAREGIRYRREALARQRSPETSEILANTRWSKEKSLLRILLRDSIIFPFIGLLMCMFNTLAWYVLPLGALQYTMNISAMGSPILGCRLILNLRDAYYRPFADELRNSTLRGKEPCVRKTPWYRYLDE
ncbi:hypothetical protein H1R20_g4069, partial [Candolleomyces eurysporus]